MTMEVLAAFAIPEILKLGGHALLFAWEQYANVQGNQSECHLLIQRCQDLFMEVANHYSRLAEQEQSSYIERMGNQLRCLEGACLAVQATIGRLARKGFAWRLLNQDKIKEELTVAEYAVSDAVRAFNIGAHIGGQVLQMEIAAAQKKDQDDLLARLDNVAVSDRKILDALQEDSLGIKRIEELVIALEKHVIEMAQSSSRQLNDPTEKFIRTASSALQRMSGIKPDIPHWTVTSLEVTFDPRDSESCIGKGGFGNIFKGDWHGQVVAVKEMYNEDARLLDRDSLKVIHQEIMIWSRIAHPHVLPFYGACLEAARPFMVTRYCENGNALEYLRRNPDTSRIRMLHEVSLGMTYLHNQSIIHADLKGSNILVGDDGKTLITDFGLSQLQDQVSSLASRSKVSGTLRWMAPELLDGERLSRPADVYSFALLGWELYTGVVPFGHIPERAFVRKVVDKQERPERPDNVDDEIWELLQKCWVHEPSERPPFAFVQTQLRSMLIRGLSSPLSPRSNPLSALSPTSSAPVSLAQLSVNSLSEPSPPPYQPTVPDSQTSIPNATLAPAPAYTSRADQPIQDSDVDNSPGRTRIQQRVAELLSHSSLPPQTNAASRAGKQSASSTKKQEDRPSLSPAGSTELRGRAIWDYVAQQSNELSFKEDDIIVKIQKPDEDWWFGQGPDGKRGLFPANHIEVLDPIPSKASKNAEKVNRQAHIQGEASKRIQQRVAALLGNDTTTSQKNAVRNEKKRASRQKKQANPRSASPDASESTGLCGRAIWGYTAQYPNELTFKEDDVIVHIQKPDEDWWFGQGPDGEQGVFPAKYVELLNSVVIRPPTPTQVRPPLPVRIRPPVAIAEYDYTRQEENEISFKEGQGIHSIDRVHPDWWAGTNAQGERGLFPSNYVTLVEE
ncbi:hypothetical protein ONZ45_g6752 [Pleurotus djamor]|nr:hypothetical protein ONZ45_g6752 [Pleurotus djamor]